MKLGILGTGMIVREFLPWLAGPDCPFTVQALCSTQRSAPVAAEMCEQYGIPQRTTNYFELLQWVDVIYLAVPNLQHYRYAKVALEAGKHVIVEKPMACTAAQTEELAALAREVGRICRRSLEPPQVLSCKGMTTLLFAEKPLLRAVFGTAGAAARGEISGDAVQQFCSAAAAQMILCDGMGTGRPAAVDGNLAAELTARLLKAGFTAELAARLVNVALALKSDEESGATLDLVSVDLYTGTARLFKAGAAPGFLVHGGKARAVGEASLPMGILGGVSGQSRVVHLAAGDYVVLVSDGLLADGPGWVLQQLELSAAKAEAPDLLAKKLVEAARARAVQRGRPDDITAAAREQLRLLFGRQEGILKSIPTDHRRDYHADDHSCTGRQRRLRVHRGGGAGRTL